MTHVDPEGGLSCVVPSSNATKRFTNCRDCAVAVLRRPGTQSDVFSLSGELHFDDWLLRPILVPMLGANSSFEGSRPKGH
jgi:hypothetical protein